MRACLLSSMSCVGVWLGFAVPDGMVDAFWKYRGRVMLFEWS